MKKITLSPSKLSLFKECKRCFWLHVKKGVKRPEGIFPSLPGGMDRVLKRHFDDCRRKGRLPTDIEGKLKGNLFTDVEKLKVWRNNRRGLEYVDKRSGIILRGALDDLFVTEDGSHVPLDFKTRGYPLKGDTAEHYQHQMDVYRFLLEENGMRTGNFACLVFYHPTKAEGDGRFRFGVDVVKLRANKNNGKRLFEEAIETLSGEEPEIDESCAWCKWNRD